MERAEILAAMADPKLLGMRVAYDELMATAVRRQHGPQRVVNDLPAAEINEKKARSVKYQTTVVGLPVAPEIEKFTCDGTPVNETLVRDLARGEFPNRQRNVVPVGGTGTGAGWAQARPKSPSASRGRSFAREPVAASSTSWIWSTSWTPRPAPTALDDWPDI